MIERKERLEGSRICFIPTPDIITKTGARQYTDPRVIAPDLEMGAKASVDVIQLEQPESGDLSSGIAEAIHSRLNDYDGFVVTAGKFDLQYIAPRLAFAFGPHLSKTIIVTGTNIPASYPHSGARENLIRAAMAANKPFNEVAILFNDLIVRGANFQIKPIGSSLISYLPYRTHGEKLTRWYGQLGEVTAGGVSVDYSKPKLEQKKLKFLPDVESNIVSFGLSPIMEPQFIEEVAMKSAGLVLYTEAASLPSRNPYSLTPLVSYLTWKGIPVLVAGRSINDPPMGYKLSPNEEVIDKLGAIISRHMNPVVAVSKFQWVIKRVEEEIASGTITQADKIERIKEWMVKPYAGEFGIDRPFYIAVKSGH